MTTSRRKARAPKKSAQNLNAAAAKKASAKAVQERITLRVPEIADLVGVSKRVVYRWIHEGRLRATIPQPQLFLVRPRDLEAFLERWYPEEPEANRRGIPTPSGT